MLQMHFLVVNFKRRAGQLLFAIMSLFLMTGCTTWSTKDIRNNEKSPSYAAGRSTLPLNVSPEQVMLYRQYWKKNHARELDSIFHIKNASSSNILLRSFKLEGESVRQLLSNMDTLLRTKQDRRVLRIHFTLNRQNTSTIGSTAVFEPMLEGTTLKRITTSSLEKEFKNVFRMKADTAYRFIDSLSLITSSYDSTAIENYLQDSLDTTPPPLPKDLIRFFVEQWEKNTAVNRSRGFFRTDFCVHPDSLNQLESYTFMGKDTKELIDFIGPDSITTKIYLHLGMVKSRYPGAFGTKVILEIRRPSFSYKESPILESEHQLAFEFASPCPYNCCPWNCPN